MEAMEPIRFRHAGSLAWNSAREALTHKPGWLKVLGRVPYAAMIWLSMVTTPGWLHDQRRLVVLIRPRPGRWRRGRGRAPGLWLAIPVVIVGFWLVVNLIVVSLPRAAGPPVVLLVMGSPLLVQLALVATGTPPTAPKSVDWVVGAVFVAPTTRPVARVFAALRDHVPPGEVVGLVPETPAEVALCRRLGWVTADADGRWMVFRLPEPEAAPSPPDEAPPAPLSASGQGGMRPTWTGTTMTWTST